MSSRMKLVWLSLSLLATAGFLAAGRAEAPVDRAAEPPRDSAEQRIREALEQEVNLQFQDTPLSDAINVIKGQHNIQIQLDTIALREAGVDGSTPMTLNVRGISLRSALRLMLKQFDVPLTWMIRHEVMLITTKDEAESILTTTVYPVADLLVLNEADYFGTADLQDLIARTIEPDSWDDAGGVGSIALAPRALVIAHNEQIHEQIGHLLADLRAARAAQSSVAEQEGQAIKPAAAGERWAPLVIRTYRLSGISGEDVVQAIQEQVVPDSWQGRGGTGSARIVRADPEATAPQPSGDVTQPTQESTEPPPQITVSKSWLVVRQTRSNLTHVAKLLALLGQNPKQVRTSATASSGFF